MIGCQNMHGSMTMKQPKVLPQVHSPIKLHCSGTMSYQNGYDDTLPRHVGKRQGSSASNIWQYTCGLLLLLFISLSIALWRKHDGSSATCGISMGEQTFAEPATSQQVNESIAQVQAGFDTINSSSVMNSSLVQPASNLIRHIVIIGERHSGTNHLAKLLIMSLDLGKVSVTAGWFQGKHHLQPVPNAADYSDVLIIGCVRNIYDWLNAMYKMCYCCEEMAAPRTPFNRFATMPFITRFAANCDNPDTNYAEGGRPWRNIFETRTKKILNLKELQQVGHNVELFRLEDVWQAGSDALDLVMTRLQGYDLPWIKPPEELVAQALHSDSRAWYRKEVDPNSRITSSVYLSPEKHLQIPDIKARVLLINSMRDDAVEAWAGYHALQVSGGNPIAQLSFKDFHTRRPLPLQEHRLHQQHVVQRHNLLG